MQIFRKKDKDQGRATEYATCRDFQKIFTEDMAGLHQLAYLLTADTERAEACFVAGLDESIHGNPVFKQWARAWSKRSIIRNAIKMMDPLAPQRTVEEKRTAGTNEHPVVAAVAAWPILERFVFVMAVLEGYSPRECSTLLGCPLQDVLTAKSSALQKLLGMNGGAESAADLQALPWAAALARAQAI